MAMETKHVKMDAKQQKQLDEILRGIAKERKVAVEADLDTRLSYREPDPDDKKAATWQSYSRFLLSDGHTVYVDLRKMKASVSSKPDKFAQAKVEKRLKKQQKAAERKAKAEVKKAAAPKPEPKVKKAKKAPKAKKVATVKFDDKLSTLGADDKVTPAKD